MRSYAFGLTPLYAYVLSIYWTPPPPSPPRLPPAPPPPPPPPPHTHTHTLTPNNFLFRFKFSSLTISRLFSFLLLFEVNFHKTNIKKISMVSIYSLRPFYTFLYTIENGNVIASFVQKKKRFEILWSKKIFLRTYATLKQPSPLLSTIVRIWLEPSPPSLCVHTMWMTLNKNDDEMKKSLLVYQNLS